MKFTLLMIGLILILIGLIVFSLLPRPEEFTRPDIRVSISVPEKTKEVVIEKNVRNVAFDLGHEPKYSIFGEYSRFASLFRDSESWISTINGSIENLVGIDILVIISPNLTYTKDEMYILDQAIKKGMTLILLGEKESAPILNELSFNTGILFNNERVYDLTNYWLFYRNPILGEFVENNITRNLTAELEKIVTHDACSLTVVKPANSVIYTKETARSSLGTEKVKLPVVAVAEVGKGKVLAICDTDIFTNKNIELFDNLIFARNIVNWS
ncbi:MAG: hypothetical protein QW818_02145 [Candidatus Aenigmatarchaeota archaeon]|nr:hypothetical protein [Candidatus Aenigmarchaeota archaeon]